MKRKELQSTTERTEKKLAEEDMYAKFREVQIKEAQLKDAADREKRRQRKRR